MEIRLSSHVITIMLPIPVQYFLSNEADILAQPVDTTTAKRLIW